MPANKREEKEEKIPAAELSRRVAIVKRFRELLRAQRDRFRVYLSALDKQREVITRGTAEDLVAHVEMEERMMADIFAIQKVVEPMEAMYRGAFPAGAGEREEAELTGLKAAVENLKIQAVVQVEANKQMLSRRMIEIRRELKNLRPLPIHRPAYQYNDAPALIDIRG